MAKRDTNDNSLEFIAEARERRRQPRAYAKLMKAYGGALIGINDWKKKHLTESFSHYVTVADEAFLWLCLDTYLPIYNPVDVDCINPTDGHILMVSNKDTGVSKNSATPLTPTGNDGITQKTPKTSPTANGNRYGWTKDGILQHNQYFKAIERERKEITNFDAHFLKECQQNANTMQSTAQQIRETPTLALNCLSD